MSQRQQNQGGLERRQFEVSKKRPHDYVGRQRRRGHQDKMAATAIQVEQSPLNGRYAVSS